MAFTAVKQRRTPPKKRVGQHHRQNHHYVKHYWPYLPMAIIAISGVLLSSSQALHSAVLGTKSDLAISSLLARTNEQRTLSHESKLTIADTLNQAAQAKANDMVQKNYWSHISPDGATPWSFMTNSGYQYQKAGENLAYGFSDSSAIINGWMHSASHRANILNADYSQVGFGIVQSPDYLGQGAATVIVAMYALPASSSQQISYAQSSLPADVKGATTARLPITRVASLSGEQVSLLPVLVIAVSGIALITFMSRHARFLHRSLIRGEQLALRHPIFDFALMTVIMLGFIFSRTVGFIG